MGRLFSSELDVSTSCTMICILAYPIQKSPFAFWAIDFSSNSLFGSVNLLPCLKICLNFWSARMCLFLSSEQSFCCQLGKWKNELRPYNSVKTDEQKLITIQKTWINLGPYLFIMTRRELLEKCLFKINLTGVKLTEQEKKQVKKFGVVLLLNKIGEWSEKRAVFPHTAIFERSRFFLMLFSLETLEDCINTFKLVLIVF